MTAVYAPSERELMRDLPVREQALVHTLKAFTYGEIQTGRSDQPVTPPSTPGDGSSCTSAPKAPSPGQDGFAVVGSIPTAGIIYTDPEDLEFGRPSSGAPRKTRPIYALVWTHKQHKVYKTKAKAQRSSRAWKLWHERWGFKVSSHATGFFAVKFSLKGDEKRACLIHEYDKDSHERLK